MSVVGYREPDYREPSPPILSLTHFYDFQIIVLLMRINSIGINLYHRKYTLLGAVHFL